MNKQVFFETFPNWASLNYCNRPHHPALGMYSLNPVRWKGANHFIDRSDIRTVEGVAVYTSAVYWAVDEDGEIKHIPIRPSISRRHSDGALIFEAMCWRLIVWPDQVNAVDVYGKEHTDVSPSVGALMVWLVRPAVVGNPVKDWSAEELHNVLERVMDFVN